MPIKYGPCFSAHRFQRASLCCRMLQMTVQKIVLSILRLFYQTVNRAS